MPGSAGVMGCKQAEYGDWKASLFANIDVSRSHERQGCGVLRRAAAARARRAARGGVRRRQEGAERRLPQAAHAAVARRLVHGRRRRSRCVRRVCRSAPRTAAADPRSASRRCRPTRASGSRDYLADTWGIDAKLIAAGRAEGGAAVPEGRDGQAARAHRAVRASVDGVQAAAALPRAVRGRAGVRAAAPGAGADADHARSRSKPPTREHAPLRHRGRRARTTTSSTA